MSVALVNLSVHQINSARPVGRFWELVPAARKENKISGSVAGFILYTSILDNESTFIHVTHLNVTKDVQSSLFQVVDKVYELAGGSWIGNQQQDLRPPIFYVFTSWIQHQKIFSHLMENQRLQERRCRNFTMNEGVLTLPCDSTSYCNYGKKNQTTFERAKKYEDVDQFA